MISVNDIFHFLPMGMNLRNHLIREANSLFSLSLAKDKIRFKEILQKNNIATPETYFEINNFTDLKKIKNFHDQFVIKPNHGLGGNGILVLEKRDGYFVNPSNDVYNKEMVWIHLKKILDGEYSGLTEYDQVLIEERIHPSKKIVFQDAVGLPDIRLICLNYEPVLAMMRYSNKRSKGRANLSAGAMGIGIDIATGRFNHLHVKNEKAPLSLSDFSIPADFVMPKWEEMKAVARRASEISGLSFSGVDVILSHEDKVMVLEINGRPGIEIQNINERSLLGFLPS